MSKAKGDDAAERFERWASSQPLSYFREIANRNRTQLLRTVIMDAVGIDRPALRQNPRILRSLEGLEERLRHEGVLSGKPVQFVALPGGEQKLPPRLPGQSAAFIDAERLSRLEKEVAAKDAELLELRPLRTENQRLNRRLRELQDDLSQFRSIEAVLRESGRLPR